MSTADRRSFHGTGAGVVSGARVLTARWIAATAEEWIEGGGLLVARGRVERVLRSTAAVRRALRAGARQVALEDRGDVLLPGLVNAHAHLDLGGLAGRTPRRGPFGGWIAAVLEARARRTPRQLERDVVEGARRALASGTTTVGDIDSSGAGPRVLGRHALRVVQYRELLDARDPARTGAALRALARRWPRRVRRVEGLSPHAPHTVSDELLAACGRRARAERLPLAVHWAESEDEVEFLAHGRGPFARVLGPSPRRSGLACLARAGLLGPRTALIHANHPARGDRALVAGAGASVVHCPGSHAFFGRAPFSFARWRRHGVSVALGTDSLASNDDLDMTREMALWRASDPSLDPRTVLAAATRGGGRALGLEREVGSLTRGARADAALFSADGRGADELVDAITSGAATASGVWIGGRLVLGGDSSSKAPGRK